MRSDLLQLAVDLGQNEQVSYFGLFFYVRNVRGRMEIVSINTGIGKRGKPDEIL